MTVNERIKKARVALNMKQIDFAKAIFVSNGYVADMEHGHRIVNERIIHLIAMVFGINEEWLKTGVGAMFNKTPEQKLERIMGLFNELTPHFQDYALKQIDQLTELQKLTDSDG